MENSIAVNSGDIIYDSGHGKFGRKIKIFFMDDIKDGFKSPKAKKRLRKYYNHYFFKIVFKSGKMSRLYAIDIPKFEAKSKNGTYKNMTKLEKVKKNINYKFINE